MCIRDRLNQLSFSAAMSVSSSSQRRCRSSTDAASFNSRARSRAADEATSSHEWSRCSGDVVQTAQTSWRQCQQNMSDVRFACVEQDRPRNSRSRTGSGTTQCNLLAVRRAWITTQLLQRFWRQSTHQRNAVAGSVSVTGSVSSSSFFSSSTDTDPQESHWILAVCLASAATVLQSTNSCTVMNEHTQPGCCSVDINTIIILTRNQNHWKLRYLKGHISLPVSGL